MKTFRVRIKKKRTGDMTLFTWPSWWSEVHDKVDILAYEDTEEPGDVEEYAVGVAEDEVVDRMLSLDGGKGEVEVVHPDYADEMVQMWKPGRKLDHFVDRGKLRAEGLTKEKDRGRPPKPLPEQLRQRILERQAGRGA